MKKNKIKIIAGKWKNKNIYLLKKEKNLRPTLSRIRETIFNWLNPYIFNFKCLDCYAGSGSLGFEALSRHAKFITFLEINSKIIKNLKNNLLNFRINFNQAEIIKINTLNWLIRKGQPYDLVFIDPPFKKGIIEKTIFLLENYNWLANNSFIYVECEKDINTIIAPKNWFLFKEKNIKKISYRLYLRQVV